MTSTRRDKQLSRKSRLQAAKHWIPKYNGKNLVRRYRKCFRVDLLCAVKELEMLGYKIDLEYKKNLRQSEEAKRKEKEKQKKIKDKERLEMDYSDSDETFCFIAGYTLGGVPFGVTWEEIGKQRG